MVKVVGPAYSMFASGKLGSLVYSRNQFGMYARNFVDVPDPGSDAQLLWRTAMTECQTQWKGGAGMTSALRDMWNEFARNWPITDRLGGKKNITGRDWFIKTNIFRRMAGKGFHNSPQNAPNCIYNPSLTLGQSTGGVYLIPNVALTGDELLYCSVVKNQSTLRNFMPKTQEYAGIFTSADSYPYLIIPNADLDPDTTRQFARVRCIDGSGRSSSPQILYGDYAKTPPPSSLTATADNFLSSVSPTENNGTDNPINIQSFDGAYYRILVAFDLSSLDPGFTCTSALLRMRCTSQLNSPTVDVRAGLTSWTELQSTWNDRFTGTNWSTPGGQSGTDFRAAIEDSKIINAYNVYWDWDITSLFNEWYSGSLQNNGIWMTTDTPSTWATWISREGVSAVTRPTIYLTWS